MREHPGKFMVQQAERLLPERTRERIPEEAERQLNILGLCYGATFGAVYAMLRPRGGPRLVDGAWFGLVTWSAGYLGWLPASGLMPPLWKHEAKQVAKPIAEHAVYGMATVAAYDWMTQWAQRRQTFLERFKEAITALTGKGREGAAFTSD